MSESIKKLAKQTYIEHGSAIQGDHILVECRKIGKWSKTRGSDQHHYFSAALKKNAFAVIVKTFTNVRQDDPLQDGRPLH